MKVLTLEEVILFQKKIFRKTLHTGLYNKKPSKSLA